MNVIQTQFRRYHLAFNAKAKARPNFGLRGVGYYSSEVYQKSGQNFYSILAVLCPVLVVGIIMSRGFFSYLDAISGGGPKALDYGFNKDTSKPWEFNFDIGEGYAAGAPRLRPAPGAPSLHHDDDHHDGHH
eukprot:GILI01010789.1.p1 GENE.GILI01010789.1~~GILI01010789.1.p1  ORF type:complete len:138 (+),score=27.78 GILI01010789.1:24-416(+)